MEFINEEICRLEDELRITEVGSDEYDKILKQLNGLNAIRLANEKRLLEADEVRAKIEADDKKLESGTKNRKRDFITKVAIGTAGVVTTVCLHLVDLEFEREGTFTSSIGRATLSTVHKVCGGLFGQK